MDSKEDIKYVLDFFHMILLLILVSLVACVVAFWFQNFETSFAVANTGASIGILLAAFSARSAKGFLDRGLLILGLFCTVGFQIWSMAAA